MSAVEMRKVYSETLIRLAEANPDIVLLEADLMVSVSTVAFKERFPERTFDVGVAEANMVGIAAGLSAAGKIPFAHTFGCFASRRVFDQFFISANYARLNVKLVGSDPGVTARYNGGTHMPFEDLGLMRIIPRLTVFEPSDPVSLAQLMEQSAALYGCTYLRLQRFPAEPRYPATQRFTLGKGVVLRDGHDVTLIAMGVVMVDEATRAAELLAAEGISAAVIDMHTLKPLDRELVLTYAEKTGALVTCENHQVINGLGSAVAEVLAEYRPTPLRRVGVQDEFGEVGPQDYLIKRFKLSAEDIVAAAKDVLRRK